MSASTLRRAAALIRQRANATTGDASWTDGHYWVADYDELGDPVQSEIGGMGGTGDAEYYSSWTPAVALDAARLFDAAEKVGPAHGGILWDATVTLARTYLGDQS